MSDALVYRCFAHTFCPGTLIVLVQPGVLNAGWIPFPCISLVCVRVCAHIQHESGSV